MITAGAVAERLAPEWASIQTGTTLDKVLEKMVQRVLDLYGEQLFLQTDGDLVFLCVRPAGCDFAFIEQIEQSRLSEKHYLSRLMTELVEAAVKRAATPTPTGDNRKVSR